MAQHIPIKNSDKKELQEIYKNICKNFEKGLPAIQSSLRFQEIEDENFKESENDKIFQTWKNLENEKEIFEIHFDSRKNKITNVYLVK